MQAKQIYTDHDLAIQKATYTCGPTSLLNVLQLKGDDSYTEEELAEMCGAKPGIGTQNEDLLKVAQEAGLEIVESKEGGTIDDIERLLDDGAYVIVCYHNAFTGHGHFSVINDYDDQALYFRDSSSGLFRMWKEYFPKWWYGDDGSQHWFAAVK